MYQERFQWNVLMFYNIACLYVFVTGGSGNDAVEV